MKKEVPDAWQVVPLEAILERLLDFRGRTPKKLGMDWGGGDIPALSALNVRMGSIALARTKHFGAIALYQKWMTSGDAREGDVIITTEAPLGNVAQIPDSQRYILSQRVILLQPHRALVAYGFLAHQLRSPPFQLLLSENDSGTTVRGIRQSRLVKLPVRVPPLNEQRRIVEKIEALTAKSRRAKAALDAIPPLLERFRQSVLAAAFRGDLTKDWRAKNPDVEPASVLLERIRKERRARWEEAQLAKMRAEGKEPKNDNWKARYKEPVASTVDGAPSVDAFGDIADLGWTSAPLEGLCDPQRGIPYGIVLTGDHVPGGIPTVRCGDVKKFDVDTTGLKLVQPEIAAQYKRTQLEGGEVLLAVRGTVGAVAVASNEMRGMNISREVAMITPLPGLSSQFLMCLLASPVGQRAIAGQVKGVAQRGINLSEVRTLPLPLPSREEQAEIVAKVDAGLTKIAAIQDLVSAARASAETLDQAILAKAFRGKLVPQDPNDEPAAALLERIRTERDAESSKQKRKGRRSTTQAS